MFTRSIKLLDAVTADTTSVPLDVSMRGDLSIQFTAALISSGNGVFSVEVTNDEDPTTANWVTYNRLNSNVANTNAQNDTRVASVTLSQNGSAIVFRPNGDYFRYLRVKVDMTTDGAYSAVVSTLN